MPEKPSQLDAVSNRALREKTAPDFSSFLWYRAKSKLEAAVLRRARQRQREQQRKGGVGQATRSLEYEPPPVIDPLAPLPEGLKTQRPVGKSLLPPSEFENIPPSDWNIPHLQSARPGSVLDYDSGKPPLDVPPSVKELFRRRGGRVERPNYPPPSVEGYGEAVGEFSESDKMVRLWKGRGASAYPYDPSADTEFHEYGHALDWMLRDSRLGSDGPRFQALCTKYNSGTAGGGGGPPTPYDFMDDPLPVHQYFKSCKELYAEMWQRYLTNPEQLKSFDPQMFAFMQDAEREARRLLWGNAQDSPEAQRIREREELERRGEQRYTESVRAS